MAALHLAEHDRLVAAAAVLSNATLAWQQALGCEHPTAPRSYSMHQNH